WIGKSEGAEIDFKIDKHEQKIRVFTTRPDTLYGGTFLVLAPEHSLIDLIVTEEQWPAVREYREKTARKSDLERAELTKEKSGVFTGAYAINPATEQKIPIWIADYVLLGYGTGAIGGVPAHDERDLEFAKRFDRALDESELPVIPPPLEDYKPTGTGEPPLAKAKDWVRYSDKAVRELNVMPQWAGSCWYYLRFCDPQNDKRFVGKEAEKYWMGGPKPGGVDLYVGGTEHA